MRKIQLDLSELRVESFAIDGASKERGTVEGQEWTFTGICCPRTDACSGNSCSGDVACICNTQDDCV